MEAKTLFIDHATLSGYLFQFALLRRSLYPFGVKRLLARPQGRLDKRPEGVTKLREQLKVVRVHTFLCTPNA